jgi:sugar phosphate isomerase/epimerase
MRLIVPLLCLLLPIYTAAGETTPIYPFQNGVNSLPPPEGARLAKELGYQGIGSIYPNSLEAYKTACEAEGLKVFSIYVGGKVNADGFEVDNGIAAAITLLKGTDALVELNVQRGKEPNDEQAIALVRHVADMAKEAGLKVVLYPHFDFHIERFDHALKIAKASERDNVGVAFNLCHFLKIQPNDNLPALLAEGKPLLWSVSICGADSDGKDWNTLIRPLGEGTYDQAALLRLLKDNGYNGAVGLQCFNIRIAPRDHLTRSIAAWRKHLAAAALL